MLYGKKSTKSTVEAYTPAATETNQQTEAALERPSAHAQCHARDRVSWNSLPDLPERYGLLETVYSRFPLRRPTGVFDPLRSGFEESTDIHGCFGRALHHVDGTMVRAHQ